MGERPHGVSGCKLGRRGGDHILVLDTLGLSAHGGFKVKMSSEQLSSWVQMDRFLFCTPGFSLLPVFMPSQT